MNIESMSKYKARKLLKELKIEVKRLSEEVEKLNKSKFDILRLMESMESHIEQTL